MYSFEACYNIKIIGSDANEKCTLNNEELHKIEKEPGRFTYKISIPRVVGRNYPRNQLCTFSFPPPQSWHVYTYMFEEGQYNIEPGKGCRCEDSIRFEHTEANSVSRASILSCGYQIDGRVDGKELKDSITITFRSNEKVQKKGTQFFISESSLKVCKLVSMVYNQPVR